MGLFIDFTHRIMGKYGITGQEAIIVDGIFVNEMKKQEPEEEPLLVDEPMEKWEVPQEFKDFIGLTRKRRTVSEYCIDLCSFGVPVESLTVALISDKFRSIKLSTQRRKLTALNIYAEWLSTQNDTRLLIVLIKLKQV